MRFFSQFYTKVNGAYKYLVTDIHQNIFFSVQQKKLFIQVL